MIRNHSLAFDVKRQLFTRSFPKHTGLVVREKKVYYSTKARIYEAALRFLFLVMCATYHLSTKFNPRLRTNSDGSKLMFHSTVITQLKPLTVFLLHIWTMLLH